MQEVISCIGASVKWILGQQSWQICKDYQYGGLSFKELLSWNKAFISKLISKILHRKETS